MTTAAPPPLPPFPDPPAGQAPPPPSGAGGDRPPLRRSRDDRVIGGVAGGLAEHTGVDALLWRVGFIALVFAGGAGIGVYLLLWLLMRSSGTTRKSPAEPVGPRSPVPGITVAVLLIVVGVMALIARTTDWRPGAVGFLGAALLVVGLGLAAGAFAGGRTARGPLIALGVVLSFGLLVASGFHGGFRHGDRGVDDRSYAPASAEAVQDRYSSGVGDLTLDLTRLDLADLTEPVRTSVHSGVGDVEVVVPRSADVRVTVDSGLGEAEVFGQDSDGGTSAGTGPAAWTGDDTLEIVLDVESGIGDVEVTRG